MRTKPLQILVYQDVLCAWCYVAESRLRVLQGEFGDAVRWTRRPYPLRVNEAVPSSKDLAEWLRNLERASKEPEGTALRPDLWTSGDPPRSSVPALAALEAARLQGAHHHDQLARLLQRAALVEGVNVSRSDVIYELASAANLDMNRFSAVFQSPQTLALIQEEHRIATERGIKGAPTLIIGGRWMLSGLRELDEYRQEILTCMRRLEERRAVPADRVLH